jgi:hypothetical protein
VGHEFRPEAFFLRSAESARLSALEDPGTIAFGTVMKSDSFLRLLSVESDRDTFNLAAFIWFLWTFRAKLLISSSFATRLLPHPSC